jgi:hypothetical protein
MPIKFTTYYPLLYLHLVHLQISGLVREAESGLRLALKTMGMRDAPYWVSWMAFDGLMAFVTALLLTVSGGGSGQRYVTGLEQPCTKGMRDAPYWVS